MVIIFQSECQEELASFPVVPGSVQWPGANESIVFPLLSLLLNSVIHLEQVYITKMSYQVWEIFFLDKTQDTDILYWQLRYASDS